MPSPRLRSDEEPWAYLPVDIGMSWENAIKGAVLLIALAGLVTLSWLLPVGEWIEAFTDWIAGRGPTGVVLFGIGYVLGTVLLLPGSLASIAGMAPGAFLYAYLGQVGKATLCGGSSASAAEIAFLIAGVAATAVVSWYLARVAGKAFAQAARTRLMQGSADAS